MEKKTTAKKKTEKKPLTPKEAVLEALRKSMGNVSEACKKGNITRMTFYNWKEKDEEFRQAVEDINESCLDLAESKLMENIRRGQETSLIFYLKTKGKNRGYVEKKEADVTINGFEQLMKDLPDDPYAEEVE